jgi:predicted ATPase
MSIEKYLKEINNTIVMESYLFSGNDLILNIHEWKNEKNKNILFITGLSGSGKSTLAKEYQTKYNANMFEIDGIERNRDSTKTNIMQRVKELYPEYKEAVESNWKGFERKERYIYLDKAFHIAKKLMVDDYKNLYIIEGIQLFNFIPIELIKNKPLIIKGTSVLKSMQQRFKRGGNGKIDWIKELQNEFPQLVGWYSDQEKLLKDFKNKI